MYSKAIQLTNALGSVLLQLTQLLGDWCLFVRQTLHWLPSRPLRWVNFLTQCEFIGVKSTPIITLTGVFVGMVFALQTGKAFALFNAESLTGATLGLTLTREVAPVFTCLMMVARSCSAMAAEIGSMRVTEQIDALECMGVSPIHYLVVPRVVASTIMAPLLTGIFNIIGIMGGYLVAVGLLDIQGGPFLNKLYHYVEVGDFMGGLFKAACFGFMISAISCYCGYHTRGGAAGVGRSTTRAVVISSVCILVVDYFLTTWILEFITPPTL